MNIKLPLGATGNKLPGRHKKAARIVFTVNIVLFWLFKLTMSSVDLAPSLLSPSNYKAIGFYIIGQYSAAAIEWRKQFHMPIAASPEIFDSPDPVDGIPADEGGLSPILSRADNLIQAGQYDRSEAIYQNILKYRPSHYDSLIGVAVSWAMGGDYHISQQYYEKALSQNRGDKSWSGFLNSLEVLAQARPDKFENEEFYHVYMATLYRYLAIYDSTKIKDSLSHANKAIKLNPSSAQAYFSRGIVYSRIDNYDQALKDLLKSAELNPYDPAIYLRISWAYATKGDIANEVKFYKKTLSLDNTDARTLYMFGNMFVSKFGDYVQADGYYRRAYELAPLEMSFWYAWNLMYQGKYDKVLEVANRMRYDFGSSGIGDRIEGLCYLYNKDYENYIKLLYAAWQKDKTPLSTEELRHAAFSMIKLKRDTEAVELYKTVLSRTPADKASLYSLQTAYRKLGKHQEAYDINRRILEIYPHDTAALALSPYLKDNLYRAIK